jgi:AcrR family transcriptional regulator
MARPKKSEARDTRRDILDAALDLFALHGFYETSTRDIARRVGVRESALYHHFKSKADIMRALLEELGPGRAAQLQHVDIVGLAQGMGVREMLKSMVHMLITEWAAPREMKLTRLMVTEGYRLKSEGIISPWQNALRVRGVVAGIFEKLAKAKLIRKVDPQTAAISFMGPLMMLRLLHLGMAEGAPDLKQLLAEVDGHLDFFSDNLAILNERSVPGKKKQGA